MEEIPFVPSPLKVVRRMLELAQPREGEKLYDLGAGDGRILFEGMKEFRLRAVGVEKNPRLIEVMTKRGEALGLRPLLVKGSFYQAPLSDADIVTLYLTPQALRRLRGKLKRELRPGARIVCHDYPIQGWRPSLVEDVVVDGKKHYIYLYTI